MGALGVHVLLLVLVMVLVMVSVPVPTERDGRDGAGYGDPSYWKVLMGDVVALLATAGNKRERYITKSTQYAQYVFSQCKHGGK